MQSTVCIFLLKNCSSQKGTKIRIIMQILLIVRDNHYQFSFLRPFNHRVVAVSTYRLCNLVVTKRFLQKSSNISLCWQKFDIPLMIDEIRKPMDSFRKNRIAMTRLHKRYFEVAIVVMSESNPIVARRETLTQRG